ncbi:MAG: DUF4097 family beta strand repeat-containing protein [Bryobacteraceae bacterium]
MNRRSIVGPLILVLIGVLFLVNNVVPNFHLWKQLVLYWPFLLIAWGILRLGEILLVAGRGGPIPPRGLSGGEIALIVLICIFGSATYTVREHLPKIRMLGRDVMGEAFDYPVNNSLKNVPADVRVLVDIPRGNAKILGADTNEVRVSGRKTIRAFDKQDADRANDQTPLEMSLSGNRLVIRTNQDKASDSRSVTSQLEITVPRGATFEGKGRFGDFDVTDLQGGVQIDSENAGVRLSNIGGGIKVDTGRSDIIRVTDARGDVLISGRGSDVELSNIQGQTTVKGSYSGDLRFANLAKRLRFESRNTEMTLERLPGNIQMDLGDLAGNDLVGPIKLVCKTKDIKLQGFKEALDLSVDRGEVSLAPQVLPLSKMDIRARSGEIRLELPPASKFELNARTEKGDVQNEFGPPLKSETTGRTSYLTGKVGAGPVILIATGRGTITVRKDESPKIDKVEEEPKP